MEIIERRKRLREHVIKKASNWASKLPFKVTAILIGSYARGDFNLWSDVDVLLISEDFTGGPIERLKSLAIPPGFQAIPLTPSEFRRLLTKRNHLVIEAIKFGVVLRDDLRLIQQIRQVKENRTMSEGN